MYTGDRLPDQTFYVGELFYYRVHPDLIQTDETVDPLHVHCPDLSSNRERYSKPWYVLYPWDKFGHYAVFRFLDEDVLDEVSSPLSGGGSPTVYGVRTVHDPEVDNYGHCETRLYRGDERVKLNKISTGAKKIFREHMSRILKLERKAGLLFPPPE